MGHLNFARAPFRNERFPGILYGLAVTLLLAFTVVHAVFLTRYLMREQEELDVKVASLQDELANLDSRIGRTQNTLRSQRSEAGTERIRFLARLYYHKNFSWTGLFNELEALTPPAVRIASIAPGPIGTRDDEIKEEIQVQLQVVARSFEDVLEMVRRLEANRLLLKVLPLNETDRTETDDGGHAATLTLRYLRQDEEESVEPSDFREKVVEEGNIEGDTEVVLEERGPVSPRPVGGRPSAVKEPEEK